MIVYRSFELVKSTVWLSGVGFLFWYLKTINAIEKIRLVKILE
jgi:hypothetical protein